MPLTAFIVDDEPLAREGLELRLDALDGVETTGTFGRARDALDALRDNPPDLLFLDVQMPGLDGFEMLGELAPDARPAVIFVTAYDEYAVRAFEVHAADYLLKPVEEGRLAEAVDQARERIRQERLGAMGEQLRGLLEDLDAPESPAASETRKSETQKSKTQGEDPSGEGGARSTERIAVRTRGRVVMVRPREIGYVEGAGDYVELHLKDGNTHLLRATMDGAEERLAPHGFQRIHRSTIVNLDRVRALDTDRHGAYYVCLEDGPRLKLSRSYREAFEDAIGTSF
jgi:two-component system LytT family response regulator